MSRIVQRMSLLLFIIASAALAYLGYAHITYNTATMNKQKTELIQITHQAVLDLNNVAMDVVHSANAVAQELSEHGTDNAVRMKAEQMLKNRIATDPILYGGTIFYNPHALNNKQKPYSAHYFKKNDKVEFEQLDGYDTKNPLYTATLKKGSYWSEPYFNDTAGMFVVTFSVAFYAKGKEGTNLVPQGMVAIDVPLEVVKKIVESLSLGVGGYGGLVSANGSYLYHPNNDYVLNNKTLLELAKETDDNERRLLGEMLQERRVSSGIFDHSSLTTTLPSWLVYEQVPSTDWLLINTFIKEDVPIDNDKLKRQLILMTLFSVLALASLTIMLFYNPQAGPFRLWLIVALISLFLLGGIAGVWYFSLENNVVITAKNPIVHQSEITKVVEDLNQGAKSRNVDPPIYIPTGVLIESLRFIDGNDVIISGQAWQSIDSTKAINFTPSLTLRSAEDVKFTEIYHHNVGKVTVYRWQFQARVRQHLRHVLYPFEREALTFRFVAENSSKPVVLIPDLGSYVLKNPAALPGLAKDLSLPGWEIEKSFFDLEQRMRLRHATNEAQATVLEELPILQFNVVVKKHFLDSFVSNQFPLLVVSIMLFALLLTTTTEEKLKEKMNTTAGMALSMCSALIFIVVFSHIGVRRIVVTDDIFYLEYFYFVIYLAILMVAVISIVHTLREKQKLPNYEDIRLVLLLYWPMIFGILFLITVCAFY